MEFYLMEFILMKTFLIKKNMKSYFKFI